MQLGSWVTATIFLIRHAAHEHLGHTLTGRLPGVGLSSAGEAQAAALAERLRPLRFAAIHSSPVQRARETAAALARGRNVGVEEVAALDEVDFGAWTGKSFALLADEPSWTDWNSRRALARPPGGESMAEAVARAVAHVEAAARAHDEAAVALVTHCDIIRGVIAHYLGLGLDRLLSFDVDPASVSRLAVGGWGGRLLSVNEGAL
jgi:ribonuclease H / adenosylcobalamin/alpha-ribazole phosphatase